MVFDNAKIKQLVPDYVATVPFARGVEECIAWLDADESRKRVDPAKEETMERIIAAYERALE